MIFGKFQRITIIKSRRPVVHDINEQLQWLGSSLGLFNLRDKDKSCFRIFIELLKSSKKKDPLSSDELANKLKLSRGTVMHHMNKLMGAGIVVHENGKYLLRVENLEVLINELQKDIQRTTEDLKEIAKEIDKVLGL
ncbi:MAG: ArsR family transcriptional regulator [Candidatus Woesearchaeota archaeon]|jgi:predicted transcriptional regulator|nr:ArsR family transcriptional regulator [Candidatus Woesearchaeota archaeon]MDP7324457.1 ArsR family transcriptional regulator [Candidatus Woesearchaeota archaeon]MDP7457202.1 ArsR family transcriptional regulator [Candidatus Woesearchaeota archaeon]